MKLFKVVIILGLAVVSLSSTVAFGDCVAKEVNDTGAAVDKTVVPAPVSVPTSTATQPVVAGQTK